MIEIAVLFAALVLVVVLVRWRLRQSGPSPHAGLFATLWRAIPADGDDHRSRFSCT